MTDKETEMTAAEAWKAHCEATLSKGAWYDLDYQFGFLAGFAAAVSPLVERVKENN